MLKLVGTPTSPFTRKARVVLLEKRIEFEFVVDAPGAEGTRVPELNPLGKVPVLLVDEGTTLFDSRVIVEYLDSASPVQRLIPDETRPRIQVRRWEALADGCLDAAVAIVYERRRASPDAAWIDRQQAKVTRAVDAMAVDLGTRAWCTGDFFNLSDVAVGCALGFLDLRLPEVDWRTHHPNLVRLHDKLAQRPSFRDTAPA